MNTEGVIAVMTKNSKSRWISKVFKLTVKNCSAPCDNFFSETVDMIYTKKFNRMRPTWFPMVVTRADQSPIGHYHGKTIFVSGFFCPLPSLLNPCWIFGFSLHVFCVPFFYMLLVLMLPFGHRYLSAFRRHWLMRGRAIINCTTGVGTKLGGFPLCLKCLFAPGAYIFM